MPDYKPEIIQVKGGRTGIILVGQVICTTYKVAGIVLQETELELVVNAHCKR